MSSPLVISVVLNNNRRDDTLQCLNSIIKNSYDNQKIILLDNASIDGTADAVSSLLPNVQIIDLQRNLGYAGNNNVGIQAALEQGADWIFILNEDTILAPDCISYLASCGESESRIGIVGPMVYHYDEPNIIQSAGGRMDKHYRGWHLGQNETDKGQYLQPHCVEWISGCGIMVRRELIDQVGAIDERFFYYVEEYEWCVRAREAGWEVVHVPQAKLWHKGVQRNYQPRPSVTYYATRNQLLLLLKHHAPPQAWIVTIGQYIRTLVSWTIKPKWRDKREHRDAMCRGIVDFLDHRWGQMQ
jgi:GT2 family glycosyltransferase